MADQPPPSFAALRSRRYRQRRRSGTRVVSVEITDNTIRALTDKGIISADDPDIALGIKVITVMVAADIATIDAGQLSAIMKAVGVAPQAGRALRSPPV